ncbi:MAG: hypothetical protein LYZ70_04195 [Nitrososphaerales archaeon]|nr:hypothetical protein [Nitrososphaerales archaeon]
MTAKSELFVNEVVRDAVEPLVRKAKTVPKDIQIEVAIPKEWFDIWDDSHFPDGGEADIFTKEEVKGAPPKGAECYELSDGSRYYHKIIGTVTWATKFSIDDIGNGRYIVAEPSKVKFTPMTELIDGTLVDDRLLG